MSPVTDFLISTRSSSAVVMIGIGTLAEPTMIALSHVQSFGRSIIPRIALI